MLGVEAARHTCVAGQACTPQVWGVGVGAGDYLAVLDTCGIATPPQPVGTVGARSVYQSILILQDRGFTSE